MLKFNNYLIVCVVCVSIVFVLIKKIKCSEEEERLVKSLFKGYNKLIRPVRNASDHVVVTLDLFLLQLINVYEKEQIMKTNVWLTLKWQDFQLEFKDPKVGSVRVPYEKVWTPDIVLFNNADGNYEASYKPNVLLYNSDTVPNIHWIPPAIYKSSCTIDVEYFPFDEQVCQMRFGSWTFDAQQVVLKLEKPSVNLQDYLPSGTWDVIEAPGNETLSKETNRVELVYDFKIRRKTLFYTVNLIIPTVLISFLSVFVFYLPTDEGEKMTLCISILLALVVFLLLVSKILPPTSLVIPLISKYLIFTLMMNIVTILNTVIIINWNYRTPRTHNMPKWVKVVFIDVLPKLLFMKRPESNKKKYPTNKELYDLTDKLQQQSPTTNCSAEGGEFANSQTVSRQTSRKVLSRNISLEMNENISMTNTSYMGLNNLSGKYINQETTMNVNMNIGANHNHTHRHLVKTNDGGCSNNESFDKPTTINHPTNYQRPKQQQHKNLDKLINRKNYQLKSSRNPINAEHKQSSRESATQYEPALDGSRNRFLTLSGSESIGSNRNQTQAQSNLKNTSPHNQSNTNINSGGVGGRTKRNKAGRRQQFSQSHSLDNEVHTSDEEKPMEFSPEILDAADKITFITNHMKNENDYEEIRDDWKYVALVIDRLQLYIFFSVTVFGTAKILFSAPNIFQFVDQQKILQKLIAENKFN